MTLVDTSVWVDHLRRGVPRLVALLEEGRVCCHPFVVGELACGQLGRRDHVLQLLGTLPQAPAAPLPSTARGCPPGPPPPATTRRSACCEPTASTGKASAGSTYTFLHQRCWAAVRCGPGTSDWPRLPREWA